MIVIEKKCLTALRTDWQVDIKRKNPSSDIIWNINLVNSRTLEIICKISFLTCAYERWYLTIQPTAPPSSSARDWIRSSAKSWSGSRSVLNIYLFFLLPFWIGFYVCNFLISLQCIILDFFHIWLLFNQNNTDGVLKLIRFVKFSLFFGNAMK